MITIYANSQINTSGFRLGETPLGRGVFGDINTVEVKFGRRNIISIESPTFKRSDVNLPSWGILSNKGSLSFKDINGDFAYYAEAGWLVEGLKVEIFIQDTIKKITQNVGVFYTDVWEYDNDSRVATVNLKDDLQEWQNILIEGFDYDPRKPNKILENMSMADLYQWLYDKTPEKYNLVHFSKLEDETKNVLQSTKLTYPFLNSGNLWSSWNKLCQVCALNIYKKNGQTICEYSRGA